MDRIEEIEECTITKVESGLPSIQKERLRMFNYSRVEEDDYYYQFYEYSTKNSKFFLSECYSINRISEYLDKTSHRIDSDGIKYFNLPLNQLTEKEFFSNAKIYRFLLNNYLDSYDYDGYFDESFHKACFQVCDESSDKKLNIIFEYELSKDCTQIINSYSYFVDDEYFKMLIKNNNQLLFINLYPANIVEMHYNPEIQELLDKIAKLQEERYTIDHKYESEIKDIQKEVTDLMYDFDK